MPLARDPPLHPHDPCKVWKSLFLPAAGDLLQFSIKAALLLCVVFSISFAAYFAFAGQARRLICPSSAAESLNFAKPTIRDFVGIKEKNIDITVNSLQKTDISHVLFGIGGSMKTWNSRRRFCELWWNPNVTRGFVWLDEKPPDEKAWPETSPPYRVSANTSEFRYTNRYGTRSAVRIARIVKESFEMGLENVRWFVMGDDDTVFFTENLVRVLRKYDHREMYYIGGNSESVDQDVVHSYGMAYGGGGLAISYPLAAVLVKVLDGCINRYHSFYGSDQKIQGCMDEIGVPVTREVGFHQLDLRGDPYGYLAAHPVAPLVSLHHLDYLRPIFPLMDRTEALKKLVRAYRADPGRALQHSFCYDLQRNWTIYVSWGYSVQLYPWLATAKVMETTLQTFLTWKNTLQPFTFNTRALTSDECKRPLLFFFDQVDGSVGSGETLTKYKKFGWGRGRLCRRQDYIPALKVEAFQVTAPELEPNYWDKAPRRQCCDVIKGGTGRRDEMEVRVRGCREQESVTPP